MECPRCKGRKFIGLFRHQKYGVIKKLCPKCLGHGKFDWVSIMFGYHEDAHQISSRLPSQKYGPYAFRAPGPVGNWFIMKMRTDSYPDLPYLSELILDFVGANSGYFDFWTD